MSHHNPSFIQEPGGQIERYVPPEPFCVVFIKRSFPIPSSQFHRADATHWTLNLSNFVGTGYSEIKECCLCVNGANGTRERESYRLFVLSRLFWFFFFFLLFLSSSKATTTTTKLGEIETGFHSFPISSFLLSRCERKYAHYLTFFFLYLK